MAAREPVRFAQAVNNLASGSFVPSKSVMGIKVPEGTDLSNAEGELVNALLGAAAGQRRPD